MSWNWKEDEEKKEYETKGNVTISTEEYRDLIERVQELKAAGQREHDDWYKEYRRADDLDKKVAKLQAKVDEFSEFLADHKTVKEDYDNFCLRKMKEKDDE